jgi:alpha-ribazole phosphatase
MKNYRLHLIRHGMTESNKRGAYAGRRTDAELSVEGIQELLRLKEEYEYPKVDAVFCSPLTRCIQTAGILYPDADLQVAPSMAEIDFGEYDGRTLEELSDREDFRRWLQNSVKEAPPGGESMEEFTQRVAVGLSAILAHVMREELSEVAIVTHGGVIRAILSAMALPRLSPSQMLVGNGRGYTCFANPQLWMRDRIIEVAGVMPHGAQSAAVLNPELAKAMERFQQLSKESQD